MGQAQKLSPVRDFCDFLYLQINWLNGFTLIYLSVKITCKEYHVNWF